MANPTGKNGYTWRNAEIQRISTERDALRARVRELEARKEAAQFVLSIPAMLYRRSARDQADLTVRQLLAAGIPARLVQIEGPPSRYEIHAEAVVWHHQPWASARDGALACLAAGSLPTLRFKREDE
jgi:hypothetical protein